MSTHGLATTIKTLHFLPKSPSLFLHCCLLELGWCTLPYALVLQAPRSDIPMGRRLYQVDIYLNIAVTKMHKNMGWPPPIFLPTSSLPIPSCCNRFLAFNLVPFTWVGLCPCTLVLQTPLRHVDQGVIPSLCTLRHHGYQEIQEHGVPTPLQPSSFPHCPFLLVLIIFLHFYP